MHISEYDKRLTGKKRLDRKGEGKKEGRREGRKERKIITSVTQKIIKV